MYNNRSDQTDRLVLASRSLATVVTALCVFMFYAVLAL